MKDNFQAKDIQQILRIPKFRYEYLVTKMAITPDVLEVDGQGKSHVYSFKNVLQFAYSHYASKLGFTPQTVKKMLHIIDNYPGIEQMEIFDRLEKGKITLFYVESKGIAFFKLLKTLGKDRNEINITTDAQPLNEYINELRERHLNKNVLNTVIENPELKLLYAKNKKLESLESADAYIAVNLTIIKKGIIKKIE